MTAAVADELVARVHGAVVAAAADGDGSATGPPSIAELAALVRAEAPLAAEPDVAAAVAAVQARISGLGPLQALVADPSVSEVLVNGDGAVWTERAGELRRNAVELPGPEVLALVERLLAPLGVRLDRRSPVVDARLPDGSRLCAVVPPAAVDGPCLAIRRFGVAVRPLDAFCGPGVGRLLRWAVRARQNVLVSGGTSSGKTSLVNALAAHLDPGERVVTIEDTAELALPGDHVVRLEARRASLADHGVLSLRALVRAALRLRPDRLVVGEVRGPEALDMLQALNTGHEGGLTTVHANSPVDALTRLETLVLTAGAGLPLDAVRAQIAAAVDLVVQVRRAADGARHVARVDEVVDGGLRAGHPASTAPLAAPPHDGAPAEVVALPTRPPRWAGAGAPDPGWCDR